MVNGNISESIKPGSETLAESSKTAPRDPKSQSFLAWKTIVPAFLVIISAFGAVLLFQFMFPAPFAIAPVETVNVRDPLPNTPQSPVVEIPAATTTPPLVNQPPQPSPVSSQTAYVLHDVPFVAQAPIGNWHDDRYQNACEEASILMAWHWITGQALSAQIALDAIADMVVFEQENYGFYTDSSAADTGRLMREYYNYSAVAVKNSVSVELIKQELLSGNLVIVPADGQKLGNPNFTPPGPPRHMLVIKGFDDTKSVFITNDPGTRNGKNFEYSYQTLYNAIRDYQSGDHLPVSGNSKTMIVVSKI